MQNPKYYTIAEVSELFGIGQANLRYLENVIPRFKIRKVRGRRYYSESNIDTLRNNLVNESPQNAFVEANDNVTGMPILERIMNLEKKFLLLKQKLTQKC